ncbi:MAG: hypothetical protein ACOY93_03230 [Bacillota bacterium]
MASTWKRFAAAYALELRLLSLHWSSLLLLGLWTALAVLMGDAASWESAATNLFLLPYLSLLSLAALFVAGASASRSERMRFSEIEGALPTGLEVVLGRWLACLTLLSLALAVPTIRVLRGGLTGDALEPLSQYLLGGLITLAFVSAAAWWAVTRFGANRWLFLALAGGWLFFMVTPRVMGPRYIPVSVGSLMDFMRQYPPDFTDAWGWIPEGDRPALFNLFYLGLTGLFLGLTAWRVQRSRLNRRPWMPALLLLGSLLVAAAAGSRHVQLVERWEALAAAAEAARLPVVPAGYQPPVRVERYVISADLTNPGSPRFQADLLLRNEGSQPLAEVDLTLWHQLAVTGSSHPVRRKGDLLTLALPAPLEPGQSIPVRLLYEGAVWTGRAQAHNGPVFFTDPEGVRLSTAIGWYPLAGRVRLHQADAYLTHAPAEFRLTVQAPEGFAAHSNLPPAGPGRFEARTAQWVYLFASPRQVVEQVGRIHLATARTQVERMRPMAETYDRALTHLLRFFPDVTVRGATLLALDQRVGLVQDTPPVDGHLHIHITYRRPRDITRYDHFGNLVLDDIWKTAGNHLEARRVIEEANHFLWLHFAHDGDLSRMKGQIRQDRRLTQELARVYGELGEAGVIRVLNALRTQARAVEGMPHEDLPRWVEGVLRDAP